MTTEYKASEQLIADPLVELMESVDINNDGVEEPVVSLGTLGDRDLVLLVSATTLFYGTDGTTIEHANFADGDEIDISWQGQGLDGANVSWSQAIKVLNQVPAQAFEFRVPSDKVKALAGSTASVSYQITRGANSDAPGKIQHSGVVQLYLDGLDLHKPVIAEAEGDSLDTARLSGTDGQRYASVKIDYPDMQLGDFVEVYRNGLAVQEVAVSASMLGHPLEIHWPGGDLANLTGDVITVHYIVYRGTPERSYVSPSTAYRIGPSLAALPPVINELEAGRLELEALASKLYVHIPSGATLVGDMVTLYWVGAGELGSFRDRFPVSARNVNADLKFEINNSVLQVNARRLVKVYYTLTRLINGRSVVLRSPELMFFIGNAQEQDAFAESGGMGVIQVLQAQNGWLDTTSTGDSATLVVPFASTQVGDEVSVYWSIEGASEKYVVGVQTVTQENVDADLSFTVDPIQVQAATGKRASLFYVIKRWVGGEEEHLESPFTVIRVGPLTGDQLLAPSVLQADEDDVLDPMDALQGATIHVPVYPDMKVGDLVRVSWNGGPGPGTPVLEPVRVSVVGPLKVAVPASAVAYSVNWEVLVSYEVTRTGQAAVLYSPETLIHELGFYKSELPTPRILQAPQGVLDLASATDPVTVIVEKWPLIAPGQRYWLRLEGTTTANQPFVLTPRIAELIPDAAVQGRLSVAIAKSELATLKSGSRLKVIFKVAWDADIDESEAVSFSPCEVDVRQAGTAPGAALSIDARDLNLGGFFALVDDAYRANPPDKSWKYRTATGGKPPYRYTSSNPEVAQVDASSGKVSARGNGVTTITVTDMDGATVTYRVLVSGVYALNILSGGFNTYGVLHDMAARYLGGALRIPSVQEWQTMARMNGGVLKLSFPDDTDGAVRERRVWARDVELQVKYGLPLLLRMAYLPDSGETTGLVDTSILLEASTLPILNAGETAWGFFLK